MFNRRTLVTGLLVIVLSLCLAAAAFAAPVAPADQVSPQAALQDAASADVVPEAVTAAQAEDLGLSGATINTDSKSDEKVPLPGKIEDEPQVELGQAVYAQGPEQPQADPGVGYPVLGVESVSLSAEEQQLLDLANQERSSAGAGRLQSDSSLVKLARLKAQDMVDNRYFDHNSPTYGSPFDMLKRFGISYSYAGENLAMAPSVASAHNALMASPGHRANILNGNFDRVGMGIVVSGGYRYCVQLFTGGQRETVPSGTTPGGSDQQQPQQPDQPQQPQQPDQPQQPQQPEQPVGGGDLSADETLMVQLINQERSQAGLPLISADAQLNRVARLKAKDFVENNYFSHTSPLYGSLKEMLTRFGVKYNSAGENLALSSTVARAHAALMRSPGNKANILSSKWQKVGIGIAVKGSYRYYVQIYTDGAASQPPSGGSTQPPSGGSTQPPSTNPNPPGSGTTPNSGTADPGATGLTADEQRMLDLVNAERARNGLSPLKANLNLTKVTRLKAKDMIEKNYFSHTSPTYGSPFEMMKQFGVTYRTAGENLAGAPTVDSAHTNLMNSPGHRANILNASYKEVGIGILSGSRYGKIFVQMFIG